MYTGYNIDLSRFEIEDRYLAIGKEITNKFREFTDYELVNFSNSDNSLNGDDIRNKWFPNIKADIFISHSRIDLNLAIRFAGWLYHHFKLTAFIDSLIWGDSNSLLWKIDDQYSIIQREPDIIYNYNKRNETTSHVHMMLTTALNKLIDKCECVFFINTPNSISAVRENGNFTNSPWIYSEIAITQIIRIVLPQRNNVNLNEHYLNFDGEKENRNLNITYNLEFNHMRKLGNIHLLNWLYTNSNNLHPLDKLYTLYPN